VQINDDDDDDDDIRLVLYNDLETRVMGSLKVIENDTIR